MKLNNRGQVMIFWIIGIAIVVAIGVYFLATSSLFSGTIPKNFQEVYNYYEGCVNQDLKDAVDLAGVQGGRIDSGDYLPGSDYAPFSSHLNFMGFGVPYWFYISGNGVVKTNVPTMNNLESEIGNYVQKRVNECDFSSFYEQGYSITFGKPSARVSISESSISVRLNGDLSISKDGESVSVGSKDFQIQSSLGGLFDEALNLYTKEMDEGFIENYSNDVLRLYAPVDGVLIQCAPKIWQTSKIVEDLQTALEANLAGIKFGSKSKAVGDSKYFTVDYSTDKDIHILFSRTWPQKIEINGDGVSQNSLVAEPTGNQQGLGVMGFCYVPYHYVYDLSFPVLIQVSKGNEIFQFPISVIIDKNMPRKAISVPDFTSGAEFDLCSSNTQDLTVSIKDNKYNSLDGQLYYGCLGQECSLGESRGGQFEGKVPGCLNGYLRVQSEGYADSQTLLSTNGEINNAEVFMDKLYNVSVNVLVDGVKPSGTVLVSFEGNRSASATPPENSNVELSEGIYSIKLYVYSNSTIKIPASSKQECVEVAKSGVAGLFGGKEDRCFNIDVPETNMDYALTAGGTKTDYFLEDQLASGKMTINVQSLPYPKTIEQLQTNYELFDTNTMEVSFS